MPAVLLNTELHLCLCRLIFAGKQMNDDKQAKEYNIEGGSVLHLVSLLSGHTHAHMLTNT